MRVGGSVAERQAELVHHAVQLGLQQLHLVVGRQHEQDEVDESLRGVKDGLAHAEPQELAGGVHEVQDHVQRAPNADKEKQHRNESLEQVQNEVNKLGVRWRGEGRE